MANEKLEIKILKGRNQQPAELDAMSLDVAQAFLTLLQSVTQIVETTDNNKDLRIKVSKGSVAVAIEGTNLEVVSRNFDAVINHQSSDSKIVEPWRRVQNLFLANGLEYSAVLYSQNQRTEIFDVIKESRPLKAKSTRRAAIKTSVEFISGRLIAVGGKIPNVHIERLNGDRLTITCTEENALKANNYLYKDILLSAWVKIKDSKKEYELCESYLHTQKELFEYLKNFIKTFESAADELESLSILHDECKHYLETKDYGNFRKLIRLFNHSSTDVNVLHTILVLSQFFKNNERLKEPIGDLETLLAKKTSKRSK